MSADSASAPSWLFSFVDLAFLLLIAMTQLADPSAPDLGEMAVPRIPKDATAALPAASSDAWQIRVHPGFDPDVPPFELVLGGGKGERLAIAELRARLIAIEDEGARKPLLAPHEDSRSQDMLDAAAAIETHWPERRRVLVSRRLAER